MNKLVSYFKDPKNYPTIGVVAFFLLAVLYFLFALGFLHLPNLSFGSHADKTDKLSPTPSPTEEPTPTAEPTPTDIPKLIIKKPTATPTPQPTATNTPAPTSTPTPEATATPEASSSATPTPA